MDGNAAYAQQFGPAITALMACQPQGGSAAIPRQPPPVTPASQGAFAAAGKVAPGGPQPGALAGNPPAPVPPRTPQPSALAVSGVGAPGQVAFSKQQKAQLACHFCNEGIDIKSKFDQLSDAGMINAPSADYAKDDMAGFIAEAGLRMAQAGARGDFYSNPWASAATGVLGAVEARRAAQIQAAQMRANYSQMMYQRALDTAKFQQTAQLAAQERANQLAIARGAAAARVQASQNLYNSRVRVQQLRNDEAVKRDQAAAAKESNDKVYQDGRTGYWFHGNGKAFLQQDPNTGKWAQRWSAIQQPKGGPAPLSEKDIAGEVTKLRSSLDANAATASIPVDGGKQTTWLKATDAQKQAYLDSQAAGIRARAAQGQPGQAQPNPYSRWATTSNEQAQPGVGGAAPEQSGGNKGAAKQGAADDEGAEDAADDNAADREDAEEATSD